MFQLRSSSGVELDVSVDAEPALCTDTVLGELEPVEFSLGGSEPDVEYEVRIGDFVGNSKGGDDEEQSGPRAFREELRWERGYYFESARGETPVTLRSRMVGESEWRKRAEIVVSVRPTKISEEQYDAMCDDLVVFGSGIVLDLLSKSRARGLQRSLGASDAMSLSGLAALGELEALTRRLSRDLQAVLAKPLPTLARTVDRMRYRGSERLGSQGTRSLLRAVAEGNVRAWPVEIRGEVARESLDTIEHRSIAAFLELQLEEVRRCRESAEDTIAAYEEDLRFLAPLGASAGSRSRQRIEVLRAAIQRLERLERELRDKRLGSWMKAVPSFLFVGRTPITASVPSYRRIWLEMNRWFAQKEYAQSLRIVERVKSTSRLYEQWVFLSLVSAFQAAGLRCSEQLGALGRSSRYRFTLELDRGSSIAFECPGTSNRLVVRYEPWITARQAAKLAGETVFRGDGEFSLLSPDVLVEHLVKNPSTGVEETSFAFVVDAKYSLVLHTNRWSRVDKYLGIRSVATGRPVVRQVWLANPAGKGIELRDEMITWTERGPDAPADELVRGRISACPRPLGPEGAEGDRELCPEIYQFARGMLRYMGIAVDSAGGLQAVS